MGIKILELISGHTLICNVTATIIPVTEDGKELDPLIYFTDAAELLISFDYDKGIHRIHVADWMCYAKEKPESIRASLLAFKPLDPEMDVLSAYSEKMFDVLSISKNNRNEDERAFDPENFQKILDEEKALEVFESIEKDPKKIIN